MISGYDIRENTVTPNSVFLLLLKADEKGCKDVLRDLSAFCKLIDTKVKGYDYVFELSGISDDSMLEKLRVKIDSLSASFITSTFGKTQDEKTKTSSIATPAETEKRKEQAGFFFSNPKKVEEEEVITSLELKGESLSLVKDGTETKEEVNPIEKENQTVKPFSDEEMKDVAISIEKKKSLFGGFFNKFKNALKSKKPQESESKGMKSLQETGENIAKKSKEVKEKVISSNLFKKAKELQEKAKESNLVKQLKEEASDVLKQAKDFKENISEEIKKEVNKPEEEPKEEPKTVENPFQDLGSGIIVKTGLLQAEPDEFIKQARLQETNPIEAKMQVDDIFAAETVCSFYADNKAEMPKVEQNHTSSAEKSPLEKLENISNNQEEKTTQNPELSNVHILLKPETTTEEKPENEIKEGEDLQEGKADVQPETPQKEDNQKEETKTEEENQNILSIQDKKEDKKQETTFLNLTALLKIKSKTESLFMPKNQGNKNPEPEVEKTNVVDKTNILDKTEKVKEVFVQADTLGSLDINKDKALHVKTLYEEKKEVSLDESPLDNLGKEENKSRINSLGDLDARGYVPLGGIPKDDNPETEAAMLRTIGAFDKKKQKPAPAPRKKEDFEIKNIWEKSDAKKNNNEKGDDILTQIDSFDKKEEKKEKSEEPSFLQPKIDPEIEEKADMNIPSESISDTEKPTEKVQEDNIIEKDDVFNFEQQKKEIKEKKQEEKNYSLEELLSAETKTDNTLTKKENNKNTEEKSSIKEDEKPAVIPYEKEKGKEEAKQKNELPQNAKKTEEVIEKHQEEHKPAEIKKEDKKEDKKVSNITTQKKDLQQKEKTILRTKKEGKKEKNIMQENIKQSTEQKNTSQTEEGKPFQQISKTLVTKNFENIDHTLHISAPSQGVKSKNYPIEMPLIPTYTFANMDNSPIRFAHAMGMSTLENLGTLNNPLLLQGESGTGKTHFLHAMGYEISKKIPQSKILFTNGVRFSRGVQCLLERGKKEKLDEFFNNVEVLIIDDVHLTAVNEHNREYISKILNDFVKNKKQIILSSKYPPESLKRFEELVNFKLSVGAIAELKVPNSMHFSRLTKKMISNADISLTEDQIQEFFFEGNKSLGDVAKEIKRLKVLSRRIESSGLKQWSYEDLLTSMTRVKGEDENSEIVKKEFEEITSLQKHKGYIWGNFGFFFPASEINKFRWVAFASQEAAKELGIKGGFNYALKSAYSTEHIISAAFKIANICDVKGLKGAVILGPSLIECKEPIRENFYDILTHMLEVMMIRCGTINFEDIKKPSAYVKMLGDILR